MTIWSNHFWTNNK